MSGHITTMSRVAASGVLEEAEQHLAQPDCPETHCVVNDFRTSC